MYEFYVAGVQFHQLKTCINEVEEGNHLSLTAEPTNKYDPNAVRIEFQSLNQDKTIMLGYVPAKISAAVSASMMINPLDCVVKELNRDKKPWEQLKVVIEEVDDG